MCRLERGTEATGIGTDFVGGVREQVNKMMWYGTIFILLFAAGAGFFCRIRWLDWMGKVLRQAREAVETASRRRLLENRRNLLTLQKCHTLWYRLERELHYSGWKRRLPFLTAEVWLLGNVIVFSGIFIISLSVLKSWIAPCGLVLGIMGLERIILWLCKVKEMHSVNNNLLKFLNFLGNYSIAAGEITGIFKQVSRYVEEPIKSALTECCYETQITGDAAGALLSMAEKIEHPKFKELARNLEVSVRYSADFSLLVMTSRKSVREYLRLGAERRGMLSEALVSVLLLLIMSLFSLITVDRLIAVSIWSIVWNTLPGKIALLTVVGTLVLLIRQLYKIHQ